MLRQLLKAQQRWEGIFKQTAAERLASSAPQHATALGFQVQQQQQQQHLMVQGPNTGLWLPAAPGQQPRQWQQQHHHHQQQQHPQQALPARPLDLARAGASTHGQQERSLLHLDCTTQLQQVGSFDDEVLATAQEVAAAAHELAVASAAAGPSSQPAQSAAGSAQQREPTPQPPLPPLPPLPPPLPQQQGRQLPSLLRAADHERRHTPQLGGGTPPDDDVMISCTVEQPADEADDLLLVSPSAQGPSAASPLFYTPRGGLQRGAAFDGRMQQTPSQVQAVWWRAPDNTAPFPNSAQAGLQLPSAQQEQPPPPPPPLQPQPQPQPPYQQQQPPPPQQQQPSSLYTLQWDVVAGRAGAAADSSLGIAGPSTAVAPACPSAAAPLHHAHLEQDEALRILAQRLGVPVSKIAEAAAGLPFMQHSSHVHAGSNQNGAATGSAEVGLLATGGWPALQPYLDQLQHPHGLPQQQQQSVPPPYQQQQQQSVPPPYQQQQQQSVPPPYQQQQQLLPPPPPPQQQQQFARNFPPQGMWSHGQLQQAPSAVALAPQQQQHAQAQPGLTVSTDVFSGMLQPHLNQNPGLGQSLGMLPADPHLQEQCFGMNYNLRCIGEIAQLFTAGVGQLLQPHLQQLNQLTASLGVGATEPAVNAAVSTAQPVLRALGSGLKPLSDFMSFGGLLEWWRHTPADGWDNPPEQLESTGNKDWRQWPGMSSKEKGGQRKRLSELLKIIAVIDAKAVAETGHRGRVVTARQAADVLQREWEEQRVRQGIKGKGSMATYHKVVCRNGRSDAAAAAAAAAAAEEEEQEEEQQEQPPAPLHTDPDGATCRAVDGSISASLVEPEGGQQQQPLPGQQPAVQQLGSNAFSHPPASPPLQHPPAAPHVSSAAAAAAAAAPVGTKRLRGQQQQQQQQQQQGRRRRSSQAGAVGRVASAEEMRQALPVAAEIVAQAAAAAAAGEAAADQLLPTAQRTGASHPRPPSFVLPGVAGAAAGARMNPAARGGAGVGFTIVGAVGGPNLGPTHRPEAEADMDAFAADVDEQLDVGADVRRQKLAKRA
jgi:hypothetical protein